MLDIHNESLMSEVYIRTEEGDIVFNQRHRSSISLEADVKLNQQKGYILQLDMKKPIDYH